MKGGKERKGKSQTKYKEGYMDARTPGAGRLQLSISQRMPVTQVMAKLSSLQALHCHRLPCGARTVDCRRARNSLGNSGAISLDDSDCLLFPQNFTDDGALGDELRAQIACAFGRRHCLNHDRRGDRGEPCSVRTG